MIHFRFAACGTAALLLVSGATIACGQGKSFSAKATHSKSDSKAGASTELAAVRPFSTEVTNGVMTVDGLVAKVGMNYSVTRGFMYFTIPGVGTAVVAQTKFVNALPQENAFHGNVLTVKVNEHVVELTSDNPLVGKSMKDRAEAWVAIDPLYGANQYPHMGFGDMDARPYAWPGSHVVTKTEGRDAAAASVVAPPIPLNLRPKMESSYSVTVPAAGR